MPITKSAKRAHRKSQKNQLENLKTKNQFKAAIKDATNLIEEKDKDAGAAVSKAYSLIDKAVKKRVISKKRAARLKSRLAKALTKSKLKPAKREIIKPQAKPKKSTPEKKPKTSTNKKTVKKTKRLAKKQPQKKKTNASK